MRTLWYALSLLLTLPFQGSSQTVTNRWEADIAAFEAADKTNPPPRQAILFIGSSSIRLWTNLAKDFPDYQVINRGFGGSFLGDSAYFAERIILPYEPRLVVVYAGGNDINAKHSARQVFDDFQVLVEKIHARLPRTRIAYISIAPNPARWAQVETVKAANKLIADFIQKDKRLMFIDVFPQMLGSDGLPKPDIFRPDKLHLNAKGYELWKGIVKPYLEEKPVPLPSP